MVNWVGATITDIKGKVTYDNAFVISLSITKETVADVVACARARWKIKNESFNVLKSNGYHLEHNFGHGKQHLAMMFVALNLLAIAIHTVCDCLERIWTCQNREASQDPLLRAHQNHRGLYRLPGLEHPHAHPHRLKTTTRNRGPNRRLRAEKGPMRSAAPGIRSSRRLRCKTKCGATDTC